LKSAQALAQRSRIVLECAAGKPNTTVAQKLRLTHQTVGKWHQRIVMLCRYSGTFARARSY
jgi:DNA-binding NarL/FixJ family response regulator